MSFSEIILISVEPCFNTDLETLVLVVEVPNMIGNLMTMIADEWLLPVLDLRLTHKGRPLLAGDHFSDHNIVHGSTIECTFRRPPMRRRMLLRQ
ncbi:hypothetical protein MBLNU13_g11055t1 [Cladosporium sp. NU13]